MTRATWITIAGCLFVLLIVIPIVAPDHEIDVVAWAIWGGAISIVLGLMGAGTWIAASSGRPFGQRDLALDRESPNLRRGRHWARLFAGGCVLIGLLGSSFVVYWYPNKYPYFETTESPEEYALGIFAGAWFLLALGTGLLVLELYWSAVLRHASRQNDVANGPG